MNSFLKLGLSGFVVISVVKQTLATESLEKHKVILGSAIRCPLKVDPEDDSEVKSDFLATRPFSIGPHKIAPGDSLGFFAGFLHSIFAKQGSRSLFWGASVNPVRQVIFSRPKESGTWQPRNFILAEDTIIQGSLIPKGSEVLLGGDGVFHGSSDIHIRLEKDATILGQKVVGPAMVVIRRLKLERETEEW
ncbi:MAG: hypothetical protein KDD43_10680 [Bdellovibrionales bacterium]|nr:hypothetical protein [Bdellovibrionales bacterium]